MPFPLRTSIDNSLVRAALLAACVCLPSALAGGASEPASPTGPGAFSRPSANMGVDAMLDFAIGRALFSRAWVPAPSAKTASDGRGPLFNARSCSGCHVNDGRGHPPATNRADDESAVSMVLRLSVPPESPEQRRAIATRRESVIPAPVYGHQLQDRAVPGHAAEGQLRVTYKERPVTLAGGEAVKLRTPAYRITNPGYGAMHPAMMVSPRVAPQMIGLGLLEAIPEAAILALADPDDADGDGISGRPNQVWSRSKGEITTGRFGWKAAAPSVLQQSADAFATDIGISSPMAPAPAGDCTGNQKKCIAAPNGRSGGEEEISRAMLALVARYARNLAVPEPRDPASPEVLTGKGLFTATGCAHCHAPRFVTGTHPQEPHLSGRTIWPYTDLLLHDLGQGLADGRPEGVATDREWRTAPLWGIGLTKAVSGHELFLHDGRARSLTEAILWHGGEARGARDAFAGLSPRDRARLLAFIGSL